MKQVLKVHSIESFGTHDGPGIRLVIFLQGCNIKCLYCQNADTISANGGTAYTIDELVRRAVNMKTYFGKDGGVTVSGGEPLLQSTALIALFEALQAEGIHTNIDTNGTVVNTASKQLISDLSDLVMFDIKHATAKGFKQITGKALYDFSFDLIQLRETSKKPYWFRYVLVPGYTDNEGDLRLIGEKFGNGKFLKRVQILPYHKLGLYKWEALGRAYALNDTPENTPAQIMRAKAIFETYFPGIVK